MNNEKKINPLLSLSAGMIAGGIEGIITYPTEYIKTKLQISTEKSPLKLLKQTIKTQGIFALYKGVLPLVIGNSSKAGVRFFAFDHFKRDYNSFVAGLLAGCLEGVLVVTPTETIKTKLIHDQGRPNPRFKSTSHGVNLIIKEEGFRGIYRGVTAVVLRQGANSAVRMSTYTVIREKLSIGYNKDLNGKVIVPWYTTFFSGAIAGTCTVYSTMPLDVCKSKLQSLDGKEYKNVAFCMQKIVREEGIAALWKGATPRLGRLVFSGGIVFTVYESVVQVYEMLNLK